MGNLYILMASFFLVQSGNNPFKQDVISICSVCKESSFNKKNTSNDFHLAHIYFFNKQIDSSLIYVTKSIETNKYSTNQELFILYSLKGKILKEKKLYAPAIESLNKALLYNKEMKNGSLSYLYSNLGELYFYTENFKKATHILEVWKETQNRQYSGFNVNQNYHNLGVSYLHLKKYEKAEINLLKSYEFDVQKNDTLNLAYSSIEIANLYYEQYKDDLAIPYFEKGLLYAEKSNDLEILQSALLNMAVVEENRKNFSNALRYRKRYEIIRDSIYNKDKIWEFAQKDKEVAITIHKERYLNEQQRKQYYILLALLLFGVIITIGFFSLKLRKQKKRLDMLNMFKNELFSVLGHDLRAPMHQLLATGNLLTKAHTKEDSKVMNTLLKQNNEIANTMYRLLDNLLQWIRLQDKKLAMHKETHKIKELVLHVTQLFKSNIDHKEIKLQIKVPDNLTVFTDQNILKVILRNLIDNAVKFTPKGGTITLIGLQNQYRTVLIVKDNGTGIETNVLQNIQHLKTPMQPISDSSERHGTGLGMRICKLFIERLRGNMKILSKKEVGTTIIISLLTKTP